MVVYVYLFYFFVILLSPKYHKPLFYFWALEKVFLPFSGQMLSGYGPGQTPVGGTASAWFLYEMTSGNPYQHQPLCDSVTCRRPKWPLTPALLSFVLDMAGVVRPLVFCVLSIYSVESTCCCPKHIQSMSEMQYVTFYTCILHCLHSVPGTSIGCPSTSA